MCIITISREAYTQAKQVAEKVAQELGFSCVSREILIEASTEFDVPEIKLLRAIRDAPSILERFTFGKERYTAYVRASLLAHLQQDNVVYHGLAGHYFVRDIPHVLRVRILGNLDDRVNLVMHRAEVFEQAATAMEGLSWNRPPNAPRPGSISREKALQILEEIDEARRKWGLHLYGIDNTDPKLYDLVIHLDHLSTDDAVHAICCTARLPRFQATAESQRAIDDLALAAHIEAHLVEQYPRINVIANGGAVYVTLEGGTPSEEQTIRDAVSQIPGVEKIQVNVYPFVIPD